MGTRCSFNVLPYEVREAIYYLAGIPTKMVFDLTEVPTFLGDSDFSYLPDASLTEGRYGFEREFYYCEDENDDVLTSDEEEEEDDEKDDEKNVEEDTGEDDEKDPWAAMELWASRIRLRAIQGLLRVSRLVREEVLGILYGENLFSINVFRTSINSLKQRISQDKRYTIRHLMLVLVPGNHLDFTVDTEFWNPILSALKTLRIVVYQRLSRSGLSEHCDGCEDGMLFRDYEQPLMLALGHVCNQLPTECQLFTDIRGCWPDSLLGAMDGCFSQTNHRYMTTTMGDFVVWAREHNVHLHSYF